MVGAAAGNQRWNVWVKRISLVEAETRVAERKLAPSTVFEELELRNQTGQFGVI